MIKRKLIVLVVTVVVVVGGGISAAVVKNNKAAGTVAYKATDTTISNGNAAIVTAHTGDTMSKGSYTNYDQAKLANAENGKVVLNFSAPWCPICSEADKNFKDSATPDGLTLLKVDYDSSTDLKKKYGVTYQHTFVQVDTNGKLLKKWSGTSTYDEVLKQTI